MGAAGTRRVRLFFAYLTDFIAKPVKLRMLLGFQFRAFQSEKSDECRLTWIIAKVYTFAMQRFNRFLLWAVVFILVAAYFWSGLRYGMIGLNLMGVSVSDSKIIVEVLQSFVETVAIIVAGVWTYDRFVKTREGHPYSRI